MPTTNSNAAPFNEAIRTLATLFDNVYVLDMYATHLHDFTDNGSFIKSNSRGGHYNAVGYEYIAELMFEELNKYTYEHLNEFKTIEMINTDKYL